MVLSNKPFVGIMVAGMDKAFGVDFLENCSVEGDKSISSSNNMETVATNTNQGTVEVVFDDGTFGNKDPNSTSK